MSETAKSKTQPVGSVWSVYAKGAVQITRPDGRTATVGSSDSAHPAQYVLDMPGIFTASQGDKTETVEAV